MITPQYLSFAEKKSSNKQGNISSESSQGPHALTMCIQYSKSTRSAK